jgi:hypothetical protein
MRALPSAPSSTRRKAGEAQVHADANALGIFGNEHQPLRGLEQPARVHQVHRSAGHQRDQQQQQQPGLELHVAHRRRR